MKVREGAGGFHTCVHEGRNFHLPPSSLTFCCFFFSTLFAPVGFDIQITGYGLSKTYHADNEYALFSDMQDAMQILLRIISINDEK